MKISKHYYLDICDYAHITILNNDTEAVGKSTDDTGRMINLNKYLAIAEKTGVPITENQQVIIKFLAWLEGVRRKNGGNG